MSETKWTPGPWEISSNFTGPLVISPAGKKDDAIAYVFGETFRQVQEDARLISAAPDMAEALQASTKLIDSILIASGEAMIETFVQKLAAQIGTNRAALAKARGET